MYKILIADDNKQITNILSSYAKNDGYTPVVAFDGREALDIFRKGGIDICLLDVMMPGMDGFELCRTIRKESNVPIIMVTAKGEDYERIMGLDIGADDYIVKPFSPAEVMARVRAVMRRIDAPEKTKQEFTFDNLHVDLDNYTVRVGESNIALTKKEIELLWTFVTNKDKVFSRDNLLDSLWGFDYFGDTRTVDSHIKRLRAKLDAVPHPKWDIKTIWGVGYKFEVHDA